MTTTSRTYYDIVTAAGTTFLSKESAAEAWAWIDADAEKLAKAGLARGELRVVRHTITERREDVPRPARLKLVRRAA